MSDIEKTRKALRKRVWKAKNYSVVARELGIHRTTLWRFLNDNYEPETPTIRRALGLEEVHE